MNGTSFVSLRDDLRQIDFSLNHNADEAVKNVSLSLLSLCGDVENNCMTEISADVEIAFRDRMQQMVAEREVERLDSKYLIHGC